MLAYERQRFARHLCISAFFLLLLAVSWAQLEEEGNESSTSDERLGKVAVVGSGIGGASSSYFLRRRRPSGRKVQGPEAHGQQRQGEAVRGRRLHHLRQEPLLAKDLPRAGAEPLAIEGTKLRAVGRAKACLPVAPSALEPDKPLALPDLARAHGKIRKIADPLEIAGEENVGLLPQDLRQAGRYLHHSPPTHPLSSSKLSSCHLPGLAEVRGRRREKASRQQRSCGALSASFTSRKRLWARN
eukprot:764081-Hanusia_phi.AAC.5